jgi:hypothetical protein
VKRLMEDFELEREKTFSPQKKAKNLVYYEDRIKELTASPQLVLRSPGSISSVKDLQVTTESTIAFAESKVDDCNVEQNLLSTKSRYTGSEITKLEFDD